MNPLQLPPGLETLRKEIRNMIPETSARQDGLPDIKSEILDDGTKTYLGALSGGEVLAKHIFYLTKALGLHGWHWHLVHFPKPTKLRNDRKEGYLIPLSKHITLEPGGQLDEGSYIIIESEPLVHAGATILILVPPPPPRLL